MELLGATIGSAFFTLLIPAIILSVVFGVVIAAKQLRELYARRSASALVWAVLVFFILYATLKLFHPHSSPLFEIAWMAVFTWPLLFLPRILRSRFSNPPLRPLSSYIVYVAAAIPVLFVLYNMHRAELAAIFLPFFSLIAAVLAAAVACSLCLVGETWMRIRPANPRHFMLALIMPALALALIVYGINHNRQINLAQQTSDPETIASLAKKHSAGDIAIDEALVKNMATPAETLSVLVARGLEMATSPRASSGWMQYNNRYMYIMRDVGGHPNLAVSDIKKIFAYCKEKLIECYTELHGIAENPNTPANILRALAAPFSVSYPTPSGRIDKMNFDLYYTYIGSRLACNPALTHDLLQILLPFEGHNSNIHYCLAHHPRSSCDMLKELAKSKYNRVSQPASGRLASECKAI